MIEKIKDKIEDLYYGSWLSDVGYFFINLPTIIKANLKLFYYFNKNKCYFDWDYDYFYSLLLWKLAQMRDNMKGVKCAGVDDGRNYVSDEIQAVLDCFELYLNPEIMSDKRDEEAWMNNTFENDELGKEYILKLYKIEEECWNDFHDMLKARSRSWWD